VKSTKLLKIEYQKFGVASLFFTKSFFIGYHFLTKPIPTLICSQQPIRMIQLG